MTNLSGLKHFTKAYIATALWASTDDNYISLEGLDADLAEETRAQMEADCRAFYYDIGEAMDEATAVRAGHDFWLTRNGHGRGFWEGHWPEPKATEYTNLSEKYGEVFLYVGDDGKIYQA